MSIKQYARKRDFEKTPEPKATRHPGRSRHRFVIQKHAATRLHYDFRLEFDGALKSWAVPKGIPFAKGEKRLAVHVEDHPVSYIHFEGTIPKGQYGGGTVMVWDTGTFKPLTDTPQKDLASGKLHFVLEGKKLKGEWYLVRLRDSDQWLLIRGGEDMRPVSARLDDTSALSGKSMKSLAKGSEVWNGKSSTQSNGKARKPAHHSPIPEFVECMMARLVESPPEGDWLYEIKFDGFRALALKGSDKTRLVSRNQNELGGKFPEIVEGIEALSANDAIIDGEIVALDKKGRSSFQSLQAFELGKERPPIYFYAFDLIQLNGEKLSRWPLVKRKAALEKLLENASPTIRYSASLGDKAAPLLKKVRRLGLEGLIGKRKDSHYEHGRRSGAWIKLKIVQEQEFVIGGYTEPGGTRKHFGALLVGVYEKKRFLFTGKVGTGFNESSLRSLFARFAKIPARECPFADMSQKMGGRYGLTPSELKRCHWVKPTLVCQIKFSEWTRDGKLRQPVFLGLREDKEPKKVIRERPT